MMKTNKPIYGRLTEVEQPIYLFSSSNRNYSSPKDVKESMQICFGCDFKDVRESKNLTLKLNKWRSWDEFTEHRYDVRIHLNLNFLQILGVLFQKDWQFELFFLHMSTRNQKITMQTRYTCYGQGENYFFSSRS